MLGYVTPAHGVVMTPVTNFGLHHRDRGVVTVNTSVGAWRKIARIRRNPNVALAFHTRAHASHSRRDYVLVQGAATVGPPIHDYPSTVLEHWERVEPWSSLGPVWKRWMRIYALRVEIRIAAERIVSWPDLSCDGERIVVGDDLPDAPPASQKPPANGTGPRVGVRRTAFAARRLPHTLLGWVGSDGRPFMVPVRASDVDPAGVVLSAPSGLVPSGSRRAGLTAHWFSRGVTGQCIAVHTGWLESTDRLIYAPHTRTGHVMPPSRLVYRMAAGGFTRLGARQAPTC